MSGVIALVSGTVAVRRGRPRRDRLRRRRLQAGGLRRDAQPRPGGRPQVLLHAHLVVRDDALALYGFATEEERELFLMLLERPVGRAEGGARGPLGRPAAGAAGGARRRRRGARLQAVPGIGKRTAERIIVELREKVGATLAGTQAISITRSRRPADARARGPGRPRLQPAGGR